MAVDNNKLGRLSKPNLWQSPVNGSQTMNTSEPERLVQLVGGAALTAYGLTKQSPLGWLIAGVGGGLAYQGATGRSMLYERFGINTARTNATSNPNAAVQAKQAVKVKRSVTIGKPAEELYRYWRNFENLPSFMEHLNAVTVQDNTHSHWVAKGPANTQVAWDAEIIGEKENEMIAWQSLPGSQVANAGTVRFRPAPGGRGTEVIVELDYQPPAGVFGAVAAKLFGEEPTQTVQEDLRHFKQLMEAGEKPNTKGQPSCRES